MWPTAYFGVKEWLKNHPYSIEIAIWPFVIVGAASFLLVLLTIAVQSQKAARANPVYSIRNE